MQCDGDRLVAVLDPELVHEQALRKALASAELVVAGLRGDVLVLGDGLGERRNCWNGIGFGRNADVVDRHVVRDVTDRDRDQKLQLSRLGAHAVIPRAASVGQEHPDDIGEPLVGSARPRWTSALENKTL